MIIIEVEGIDKSGKHTQSKLLTEFLKNKGLNVVQSEFHRYDTPTGKLIRKWLYKKWDVDTTTIKLIMSADKQAQQSWFKELESEGVDVLILDRYIGSQNCFALAEGYSKEWVESLSSTFRKPDLSIIYDITASESISRKGQHGENDRYEEDYNILTAVRNQYMEYCKDSETNDKFLVDCIGKTIEEIHDITTSEVSKYLNL